MPRKILTVLVVVAVVAAYCIPVTDIPPFMTVGHAIGPYGVSLVDDAVFVVLAIVAVALMRRSLIGGLRDLGLLANPLRALLFAIVATSPAWVGFLLTAEASHSFTPREFILLCWVFPFAEEVIFRGFAFGQLYRRAGWNFWLAALVPAALFGGLHVFQSTDPMEMAGIFAITAFGSVVFSFFFVRFNDNLWVPVFLHALMNTWWMVFTPNQNALGGLSDNIFRFGSIGLALGLAYAAHYTGALRWLVPQERVH